MLDNARIVVSSAAFIMVRDEVSRKSVKENALATELANLSEGVGVERSVKPLFSRA